MKLLPGGLLIHSRAHSTINNDTGRYFVSGFYNNKNDFHHPGWKCFFSTATLKCFSDAAEKPRLFSRSKTGGKWNKNNEKIKIMAVFVWGFGRVEKCSISGTTNTTCDLIGKICITKCTTLKNFFCRSLGMITHFSISH